MISVTFIFLTGVYCKIQPVIFPTFNCDESRTYKLCTFPWFLGVNLITKKKNVHNYEHFAWLVEAVTR